MSIIHFFEINEIDDPDEPKKFELTTVHGDRIASASTREALEDMEMQLDLLLTDIVEANPDITINF